MSVTRYVFKDTERFMQDVSVTIEVDHDVFTEEVAQQMNDFWSGSDEILRLAGNDIKKAALLRVAYRMLNLAAELGDDAYTMQAQFDEMEGHPPGVFKVIDAEGLVGLEYDGIEIEEQP